MAKTKTSVKTVKKKAWGIITWDGEIRTAQYRSRLYMMTTTKKDAKELLFFTGDKVRPVTIVWEVEE